MNIDSVKINTSLIIMKECFIYQPLSKQIWGRTRLFGVGGRRDWNSDKVLILSPMGMWEEGQSGILEASRVLRRLWPGSFHRLVPPVKWCHEHHDTPWYICTGQYRTPPKHIVHFAHCTVHIVHAPQTHCAPLTVQPVTDWPAPSFVSDNLLSGPLHYLQI